VWCEEVPDTGEKVVEDGDKGSTTVLEESEDKTGLTVRGEGGCGG
jgi:hypothetical protein